MNINAILAQLSTLPAQLDGNASNSSRLLADTWNIVGSDARVDGPDAQARRAFHRTLAIIVAVIAKPATFWQLLGNVAVVAHYGVTRNEAREFYKLGLNKAGMAMLREAAYDKSEAFGQYGTSTGHEVHDEEPEYGDFAILSAVECDRENHLSGQDEVRHYEHKANAIAKSGKRPHGEMETMAQWRKARFVRLLTFIDRCNDADKLRKAQQGVWERYLASVKACVASKAWYSQYLTKWEVNEVSSLITAKRAKLRG